MAPKAKSWDNLRDKVRSIFDQVQTSTANHKKNCVTLYKLHVEATSASQNLKEGKLPHGEDVFDNIFLDMVSRVLTVKKGSQNANRVVLFIVVYVKFILDKEHTTKPGPSSRPVKGVKAGYETSMGSRFVSNLLSYIVAGFQSKDKVVRFRCVNITAELIAKVDTLDDNMCGALGAQLMLRTQDKEPSVRSLALVALCNLISREDASFSHKEVTSIAKIVLDCLCHDPSAEVRRIALSQAPLTQATLPLLLTRSRDVDVAVRALLFSSILFAHSTRQKRQIPTACLLSDIRKLTAAQREKVVRDGLCDRETKVRTATEQMLASWFDATVDEMKDLLSTKMAKEGYDPASDDIVMDSIFAFLQLFDYITLNDVSIAADALNSLILARPELIEKLVFPEHYWTLLSPASTLFARTVVHHIVAQGGNQAASLADAVGMPVVTAFAFFIEASCNKMLDAIENLEETKFTDDNVDEFAQIADPSLIDELEALVVERAFVLSQLLKIAAVLDYSDEIGRRRMFAVTRDMLSHEYLPECLIEPCMAVLQLVTPNERELVRVVVEVIHQLQDTVGARAGPEDVGLEADSSASQGTTSFSARSMSLHAMRDDLEPEDVAQMDAIDLRCLSVSIAVLQRVNGTLDQNSTLEGVLSSLIVPAVKREELAFRERGLISLGLCGLLSEDLAKSSFQLFINQVQCSPEALKLKVLHVVFDLLMMHPRALLCHSAEKTELIIAFLLQTLEYEESPAVQAVLCLGLSKLLLDGFIHDERILSVLVLSYASPATADNQELRQCLAYFLPAYSYSCVTNQSRMQSVFLTVLDVLLGIPETEEGTIVAPLHFAAEFLDWLDPDKVASQTSSERRGDVHLQLACDIMTALYDSNRTDHDRRVLAHVLEKVKLLETSNWSLLNRLKVLLDGISETRPCGDPPARRVLQKFASRFMKRYGAVIGDIDNTQFQDDPLFLTACGLAGVSLEDDDDGSAAAAESEDEEGIESAVRRNLSPMKPSVKRKARPVVVSEDEASTNSESSYHYHSRAKTAPHSAPRSKRHRHRIILDSDDNESHATANP
ncbi:hypothetical protein NM688_g1572 [Phlebia brevispora]|uniref:Uncharacterized protein n=1 Tax=Phlebia brevispora TaxID=194682 RepID=A0ACC1TAR2_9APHY|nr:hypothetical protein NM688_g1572 [Phlebia brevispora]